MSCFVSFGFVFYGFVGVKTNETIFISLPTIYKAIGTWVRELGELSWVLTLEPQNSTMAEEPNLD